MHESEKFERHPVWGKKYRRRFIQRQGFLIGKDGEDRSKA